MDTRAGKDQIQTIKATVPLVTKILAHDYIKLVGYVAYCRAGSEANDHAVWSQNLG